MLRFALCACLAACSLSENGTLATSDGGAPDAPVDVVIADVVSEPGPPLACTTDASACTSSLPAGWAPVAFETSRALACPANFAASADVVTNPQVSAGACTCDCTETLAPSCSIGTLTGTFGATNQCGDGTNGPYSITTDGECFDWGGAFGLVPYHDWSKLGLTPGACTSMPTLDPQKTSLSSMRECDPGAACAEDVCSGSPPTGFLSCIAASNDVACPPGPFTNRIGVVADAITFACGACSACSATGAGCGAATVDYYADSNCTTSVATDNVNGTCGFSKSGVTGVTHFKYTGAVLSPTCTAGASTPSPTPTNPRTICCRP